MPTDRREEKYRILTEHGDSVWRVIVRLLGADGADAADCFQQTFVEFLSRGRPRSEVRNAGALLRRIAAARAIDVLRRRCAIAGECQGATRR